MPATSTWALRMRAAPATPYRRSRPPKRRAKSGTAVSVTTFAAAVDASGRMAAFKRRAPPSLAQARETLAARLGGFGLRIGLGQVFQRAARGARVLQLDLAVGDRQHGLG